MTLHLETSTPPDASPLADYEHEARARINYHGGGYLQLDGVTTDVSEASEQAARAKIMNLTHGHAMRLGRPVILVAEDQNGTSRLRINLDRSVERAPAPDAQEETPAAQTGRPAAAAATPAPSEAPSEVPAVEVESAAPTVFVSTYREEPRYATPWQLRFKNADLVLPIWGTGVLGRDPQIDPAAPPALAVQIVDPTISRTHIEWGSEGTRIWFADLGSTNGTVLHRGAERIICRKGERMWLSAGSVIDLGTEMIAVERRPGH